MSAKKTKKVVAGAPKKMASMKQPSVSSYEMDFFQWTQNQAIAIKNREFDKLDADHLIEEIESLGRSEKRTLESHLANVLLHVLKMKYQPGKHTRSWDLSVTAPPLNAAHYSGGF